MKVDGKKGLMKEEDVFGIFRSLDDMLWKRITISRDGRSNPFAFIAFEKACPGREHTPRNKP